MSPYDETMARCLLLTVAADAAVTDDELRDTSAGEARLMIELLANGTDE